MCILYDSWRTTCQKMWKALKESIKENLFIEVPLFPHYIAIILQKKPSKLYEL